MTKLASAYLPFKDSSDPCPSPPMIDLHLHGCQVLATQGRDLRLNLPGARTLLRDLAEAIDDAEQNTPHGMPAPASALPADCLLADLVGCAHRADALHAEAEAHGAPTAEGWATVAAIVRLAADGTARRIGRAPRPGRDLHAAMRLVVDSTRVEPAPIAREPVPPADSPHGLAVAGLRVALRAFRGYHPSINAHHRLHSPAYLANLWIPVSAINANGMLPPYRREAFAKGWLTYLTDGETDYLSITTLGWEEIRQLEGPGQAVPV